MNKKYKKSGVVSAYKDSILMDRLSKKAKTPHYAPNFINEMSGEGLKSFYQRALVEHKDFKNFFGLNSDLIKTDGPIRVAFLEKCYLSGVDEEDVELMDRLHLRRIEEINKVIDSHFLLIKDFIQKSKIKKRDDEIEDAQFSGKYEKM